jgi:hypothetical protein
MSLKLAATALLVFVKFLFSALWFIVKIVGPFLAG